MGISGGTYLRTNWGSLMVGATSRIKDLVKLGVVAMKEGGCPHYIKAMRSKIRTLTSSSSISSPGSTVDLRTLCGGKWELSGELGPFWTQMEPLTTICPASCKCKTGMVG